MVAGNVQGQSTTNRKGETEDAIWFKPSDGCSFIVYIYIYTYIYIILHKYLV